MSYLNKEQNQNLAALLAKVKALNHPLRQKMLKYIADKGHNVKVGDIYKALKLDKSLNSQQLSVLRKAGLVTTVRKHTTIYYSVDTKAIEALLSINH